MSEGDQLNPVNSSLYRCTNCGESYWLPKAAADCPVNGCRAGREHVIPVALSDLRDLLEDRIEEHREQCRQVKERAKDPEDDMPSGVAQLEVKERSAKIEELEKLREMVAAEDSAQTSQTDSEGDAQ